MFAKIFVKEWKDNFAAFVLTIIFLLVLSGLFFAHADRAALYGVAIFLLLFLPLIAILVGASGFQQEFKDHTWTYLLSRPVRKETIWVAKYFSLASIIVVPLVLFFALKALVPGSTHLLADLHASTDLFDLSTFAIISALPLFALTFAFSICILSDRYLNIFFAALAILVVAPVALVKYSIFLERTFYDGLNLPLIIGLVPASFILASLLTFARVDLSQRRKLILRFSLWAGLFLIISFGLQTLITAKGNILKSRRFADYWEPIKSSEKFLFRVYSGDSRGMIMYDALLDRVVPLKGLAKDTDYTDYRVSSASGKLAYFTYDTSKSKTPLARLRIMDLATLKEDIAVEFGGQGSSFAGQRPVGNPMLSPSGDRVAFAVRPRTAEGNTFATLFWMRTDGTHPKSLPLEFAGQDRVDLLGWLQPEDAILLRLQDRLYWQKQRIGKIDLIAGTAHWPQGLPENVEGSFPSTSPTGRALIFQPRDSAGALKHLMLMDSLTMGTKEIIPTTADPFSIWSTAWSSTGDRFALRRKGELWVYSSAKGTADLAYQRNAGLHIEATWLDKPIRLCVVESGEKSRTFIILDETYHKTRSMLLPEFAGESLVGGIGDKALFANWKSKSLWRLDLKTEKWKKVY